MHLPDAEVRESEQHAVRLKRLHLRSMRRGIREMDLILTAFARDRLQMMTPAELDLYERLLEENDPDLYAWVTGRHDPPAAFGEMIDKITATFHRN
jgi:antitoxin CptB